MASMTAREIQAAFDKHRTERKLAGNQMALMILGAVPAYLEEHPEWLQKSCDASAICQLQITLLLQCRDNQSMLEMLYNSSERLQELFKRNANDPLAGASTVSGAISGMNRFLHGKVLPNLDQAICEYRDMGIEEEKVLFRKQRASPRVIEWLERGELTFLRVLERSPHLLLVGWRS